MVLMAVEDNATLEKEIKEHREELNKTFKELKRKIEEKRDTSKNLSETSAKLRELKAKRKELVNIAKANKAEREKLKESVKGLVGKLKESRQEKEKLEETDSPNDIKSRIKKIEWKVQTEVMPYDKERELTRVKKELEKKLKSAIKKSKIHKNVLLTRSEIASKIFEEQAKHENVVKFSNESEKIRQEMNTLHQKLLKERKI